MNLHQLKRVKRVVVVVWGWHDMISICWDSLWDVTKALVEAHKASLMSVFYIEDVITILPCDRSWQSSWRKPLIILLLFTTFTQTQHEEWNNNDSSTVSSPPPWQVPRTVLLSFPHFHNFFFLLKYFYTYRLVTFFYRDQKLQIDLSDTDKFRSWLFSDKNSFSLSSCSFARVGEMSATVDVSG